jgi:hypothetical protein
MQPKWALPFIIAYFIAWAGLGIASLWIIHTRPDVTSKTLWFRRSMMRWLFLSSERAFLLHIHLGIRSPFYSSA